MNTKYFRLISVVVLVIMAIGVFSACSKNDNTANNEAVKGHKNHEKQEPINKPIIKDKHIKPDVSNIEAPKASEKTTETKTIEDFVVALGAFANPNGNEYDALAILGGFRYDEKGEELCERLRPASKSWHEALMGAVGEKCIVNIELLEKTELSEADTAVSDWNASNGRQAQGYATIKCRISTNYSSASKNYSFDVVKTDGNWHLANVGTLNKIQSIIKTEIYK